MITKEGEWIHTFEKSLYFVQKMFSYIQKPVAALPPDTYSALCFSFGQDLYFNGIPWKLSESAKHRHVTRMWSMYAAQLNVCVVSVEGWQTGAFSWWALSLERSLFLLFCSQSVLLVVITPRWQRSDQQQLITQNPCTLRSFYTVAFTVANSQGNEPWNTHVLSLWNTTDGKAYYHYQSLEMVQNALQNLCHHLLLLNIIT